MMVSGSNDFASAVKTELAKKSPKDKKSGKGTQHYAGVDLGSVIDFKAVQKILLSAVAKLPEGDRPKNIKEYTLTVVIHGDGEGAAWAMDVNPYKTWAW